MVMEHLREKIISGRYKQGDTLPSQPELIKKYGVALGTIRQSLSGLASEGWIRPEPGRGFFVQMPKNKDGEAVTTSGQIRSQIGFVWWYDISNEHISRTYMCMMHAAAEEAKKHGVELVYAQFNPNSDEDNEKLAEFIKRFKGVIITGKVDVLKLQGIINPNSICNIVIAGETLEAVNQDNIPIVEADIINAGYLAVQQLLSFGHRKLALVNESGSVYFSEIQKGVELACKDSGLSEPTIFIVNDVRNELYVEQEIIKAAHNIAENSDITGIVVVGNVNAEIMIYQLEGRGCFVPDNKSIISISGIPRKEMALKNITQIRVPTDQIGMQCARFLISGGDQIIHKQLPVRIEQGKTISSLNLLRTERKTIRVSETSVQMPPEMKKAGSKSVL
jgi:DNA-binding LacI/PurR family transcriptional regulator